MKLRLIRLINMIKLINWNVEWAKRKSKKGQRIRKIINEINPDVICYTEAAKDLAPDKGHLITSAADYGYSNHGGRRRKGLLWSSQPWQEVDSVGSPDLPRGRFISGVTHGVRFVGVCIPWRDAHVRTGRKDRTIWQDHLQYLAALKPLLNQYIKDPIPTCILGDFNQRIPRSRQPVKVFQSLENALNKDWQVATAGLLDGDGKLLIDHIVTSSGITAAVDQIIPKRSPGDLPLSDHVGLVASLNLS